FLDLRIIDENERRELLGAIAEVFDHGRFILGPEVARLEQRIARLTHTRHAVGVNSGTDALILSLRALGIGPGDEVITTPLSFIATANAIALNGAHPVFADILDDMTLDPQSIEPLITDKTRALLPVHWAGRVCRMEEILPIARKHNLVVVEDCSQAFGAHRHGQPAGSFGACGCFSMNTMKCLASIGEAGMVVTDREDWREKLEALRYNGLINREKCHYVSHNGRLDTIQAAVIDKRLNGYEHLLAQRRDHARYYLETLQSVATIPKEDAGCRDIYYTFTLQVEHRDALKEWLEQRGIECRIQHFPLMPDQPAYRDNTRNNTRRAHELIRRMLCIPASEKVTVEQREYVAAQILKFYNSGS
ncbi:MAG TPA: DegT/DnrJ/EryC1/StrS family aminotransferase, partial [Magnetococcales bacterium]|nr:DegT/DnrJ/EryC1/StrS family aminotransferase [Magnetococcales bacterium]